MLCTSREAKKTQARVACHVMLPSARLPLGLGCKIKSTFRLEDCNLLYLQTHAMCGLVVDKDQSEYNINYFYTSKIVTVLLLIINYTKRYI